MGLLMTGVFMADGTHRWQASPTDYTASWPHLRGTIIAHGILRIQPMNLSIDFAIAGTCTPHDDVDGVNRLGGVAQARQATVGIASDDDYGLKVSTTPIACLDFWSDRGHKRALEI